MHLMYIFTLSNHGGDRHVDVCEPSLSSALAFWLQCSFPREIRDGSWGFVHAAAQTAAYWTAGISAMLGNFIRSLSVSLTWAPAEDVSSTILLSLLGQGVFALSSLSAFFLYPHPLRQEKTVSVIVCGYLWGVCSVAGDSGLWHIKYQS